MIIKCEEYYREVLAHAKKTGDKTLQECFEKLKRYETNMNAEAHLMRDLSKLSLYFELYDKDGNLVMNGGIVYHGDPDESYSYTMNPTKGWQMHT